MAAVCTCTAPLPAGSTGGCPTLFTIKLLSFGEYPGITLQRAREKRMEARRLLDEGIDPGALKKAAKEAERAEITETFRNVAKG